MYGWLGMTGFPQAFPIFQTFLSTGDAAKHPGSIILPLLAPGIQDIEEGVLFQVFPKPAKYRRIIVIAGISTMMLAVILASCADTAWQIVLTQGVLFGIGGIMLNFVHVSIFSEWFDKRKGEAMGIIWLGYRLGALVFPLICQWLLDKHGYERTLRVLIAPMLALLVPSIVLFRGRYPATAMLAKPAHPQVSKLAALRTPSVMIYLLITLLFGFVVNVPKMFITTFGADLKLDTSDRALALSLHVLCNMLGTYGCGWLSDSVFYEGLIGGCAVSTSLAHFLIWGFAKTKFGLFMYAIASGLASGGCPIYWLRCLDAGTKCRQVSITACFPFMPKFPGRTVSCSLLYIVSLVFFVALRSCRWALLAHLSFDGLRRLQLMLMPSENTR